MKSTNVETLVAAPRLLSALRKGPEEFGVAAMRYVREPRVPVEDAAGQECLDLLDLLVERLRLRGQGNFDCQGAEEACIFLLEHLAARFQEQSRSVEGMIIH
jgi:hypothetical protein